jgi:hypothetical protein
MSDLFNEDAGEVAVKFDDLVGAGKKYSDPDAVAKKIVHADKHISNLETEMAELRAELQAKTSLEDMLAKLQQKVPPTEQVPNTNRQEPGSQTPQVDLAAEVQKLVKAEKDKDKRENNLTSVRQELKNRFGADYNAKLVAIAETLAVTPKFLTDMATTTPAGFLKLIDSVAKPDNNKPLVPPAPQFDAGRIQQSTGQKNKAYFDNIRKTDLNAYFSRKVQTEMHDEAMRQGSAFFS